MTIKEIPARFKTGLLSLLLLFSSKAGAAGAGLTGTLLTTEVLVGQIQTPDGVPTWLAAICVGVGPSLAWLFTRAVASFGAFYATRARVKRKRVSDMLSIAAAERGENSGPLMHELLNEADNADAIAAALEAWKLPRTGT